MRKLFLDACNGEKSKVPPVWFMRQAGRYLPEYRALREKYRMLELCTNSELAAEVTLMPIKRFDFDAAILFSDITMPYYCLGAEFSIKEGIGPVVENPIRSESDVNLLKENTAQEKLNFISDAVKILKNQLSVPLIGFIGAPYTLASYLIEGKPSRDFKFTKSLMLKEPLVWSKLMKKLTAVSLSYIDLQIEAGVDVIQVFDSWVGGLSPRMYEKYISPYMKEIFSHIKSRNIKSIHFGTSTGGILDKMKSVGADIIGVDWRTSLIEASIKVGKNVPLQGNLDPNFLLATKEIAIQETREILRESEEIGSFIFNLGHGILPTTPIENVEAVLAEIRNYK